MAKIEIAVNTCKGCALCVGACPKKIIEISKTKLNKKGYFIAECVDNSKCTGCTMCAVMCPDCAIEVYK